MGKPVKRERWKLERGEQVRGGRDSFGQDQTAPALRVVLAL